MRRGAEVEEVARRLDEQVREALGEHELETLQALFREASGTTGQGRRLSASELTPAHLRELVAARERVTDRCVAVARARVEKANVFESVTLALENPALLSFGLQLFERVLAQVRALMFREAGQPIPQMTTQRQWRRLLTGRVEGVRSRLDVVLLAERTAVVADGLTQRESASVVRQVRNRVDERLQSVIRPPERGSARHVRSVAGRALWARPGKVDTGVEQDRVLKNFESDATEVMRVLAHLSHAEWAKSVADRLRAHVEILEEAWISAIEKIGPTTVGAAYGTTSPDLVAEQVGRDLGRRTPRGHETLAAEP